MDLTASMALDYLTWDNVSSVSYESAVAVPSVADASPLFDGTSPAPAPPPSRNRLLYVPVAKRRNLTSRELAASGGVYSSLDQVWLLPTALLPTAFACKVGDVVVEPVSLDASQPSTRWTVLSKDWGKARQTWKLTCRDLVLAYDLRDTITIERPALSYDAAGVPVKAFPSDPTNPGGVVLYSALPARAQLLTKAEAEQRGIRGLEGRYEVIVGQEVAVTQEDRILLSNGMYLDIIGYSHSQRIDELPRIICERRV